MKKPKKKLKGMTLFEMIISIAIFAIMGGLLILVGTTIDKQSRATRNLRNKITEESPYAANHQKTYNGDELPTEPMTIQVRVDENGVYYATENVTDASGIVVDTTYVERHYANPTWNIDADRYETATIAGTTGASRKANDGLDLDFIEIRTTVATTAPTT